jgi:hypothetical protein
VVACGDADHPAGLLLATERRQLVEDAAHLERAGALELLALERDRDAGQPFEEDLVNDGWTDIFRNVMAMPKSDKPLSIQEIGEIIELADFKKMETIRRRVEETVQNRDAAEALKPTQKLALEACLAAAPDAAERQAIEIALKALEE